MTEMTERVEKAVADATAGFTKYVKDFDPAHVVVLDIETDSIDPFGKGPDDKVIWVGFYHAGTGEHIILDARDTKIQQNIAKALYKLMPNWDAVLVGHNIKFDLQFLRAKLGIDLTFLHLWDTQIAEYIITGQASKFASLDDLGEKYIGQQKESTVGDMIKSGIKVSTIDDDMVHEYLKRDLEITAGVYFEQMERYDLRGKDILRVARVQMDALRAYIRLEFNGLHFDRSRLVTAHFTCEQQLAENQQSLRTILDEWEAPKDTNLTSNHTISTLLWGSPGIKDRRRELVGKYKNGKDKYKFIDYTWVPEWHLDPKDHGIEEKAHGCWDVSENTLDKMSEVLRSTDAACENRLADYLDILRDSRKIAKVDGTYFIPLIEQCDTSYDGKVHSTVHQTSTHTGRTSSANPNQQNMPPVVRSFLSSRYPDGVLLESDYSQLEVCALAILTLDPILIADINAGVDIHFETGKQVFHWRVPSEMTKDHRRLVKGVNFGLIYGGGAPTIAAQTGADIRVVKQLIAAFYKRYPMVKKWQSVVYTDVDSRGKVTSESPVLLGQHARVAKYPSLTGRIYTFVESIVPENYRRDGQVLNFKPTETKNYPVQGLATADIVPMMVALTLYVSNFNMDWPLLVAVVHDSMLHDCEDRNKATEVRNYLDCMVSYSLPKLLRDFWNIHVPVDLKMEHEIKKHW